MPTGVYIRTKKCFATSGSFKKGHTTNLGRIRPEEVKEKISKSHFGITPSDLTRLKMSLAKKGKPSNRKGCKLSEETKKKLSKCKGSLNSQWKGGRTPIPQQLRQSRKYKLWRKAVLKRDNYICKVCGDYSRKEHRIELVAHHIKSFKYYPELRYVLSNGKTECQQCHGKEIKTYERS